MKVTGNLALLIQMSHIGAVEHQPVVRTVNEADFSNTYVLPKLRALPNSHLVRVENAAETGTPDINYAIFPTQGWIETKVAKSGFLYFEKFQIPWFRKRIRATGGHHTWVLATEQVSAFLYSATEILAAPREPYKKWVRVRLSDVKAVASVPLAGSWGPVTDFLTCLHHDQTVYDKE